MGLYDGMPAVSTDGIAEAEKGPAHGTPFPAATLLLLVLLLLLLLNEQELSFWVVTYVPEKSFCCMENPETDGSPVFTMSKEVGDTRAAMAEEDPVAVEEANSPDEKEVRTGTLPVALTY